jgi:glucose/arabinose dehydrogenase
MAVRPWILGLLVVAACGGGDRDASTRPDARPAPYCTPRTGTALRLQSVATGLENPVAIAAPPGDPRLFVVEQPGRIRVVDDSGVRATPFLTIDTNDLGTEQGLLGLAFHPRYADNGRFFVFYVRPGRHDLRIAEYGAEPASNVARTAETVILDVPHPGADNHNGGTLAFGPDGYLYISVGDGGGANNFYGNGQNPDRLLAKLLRIDVDGGAPYAIPPSNPWAGGGGVPEMFAWGLRNPWRFTIDPDTGDVWIGDVGQGAYEEIDVVRGGGGDNFGWAVFEGPACFTDDPDGAQGCDRPGDYVSPVMAYDRRGTGQCSVIAGPVYRGRCMPDLAGRVFFGDYCSGEVRSFAATATTITYAETTDHTQDLDPQGVLYGRLSAFGVDGYDEAYVMSRQGGAVYRIEVE